MTLSLDTIDAVEYSLDVGVAFVGLLHTFASGHDKLPVNVKERVRWVC